MVELQQIVLEACRDYEGTNTQIAELMGMSYSEFNNRLHMKNGTRLFSLEQLAYMQHVVGHPFLADYFAQQFGMLVVDNPAPEQMDNVELFSIQMMAEVSRGKVAQSKLAAEEDGVIEKSELKEVARNVLGAVRYTMKGFLAWAALHGMQVEAAELMVSRKVDDQGIAAPGHRRSSHF